MPYKPASAIILDKYGQPYPGQPGNWRVVRGGSFGNNQNNARAANRNNNNPDNRNNNIGFRVAVVRRSTPYLFLTEGCSQFRSPSPGSRTLRPGQPAAGAGAGRLPYQRQRASSLCSPVTACETRSGKMMRWRRFVPSVRTAICSAICQIAARRYRSAAGVGHILKPGRGLDSLPPCLLQSGQGWWPPVLLSLPLPAK